MPAPKDTQHDLTPDPGPAKDRGIPEGLDQGEAKGAPSDERTQGETAGHDGAGT